MNLLENKKKENFFEVTIEMISKLDFQIIRE